MNNDIHKKKFYCAIGIEFPISSPSLCHSVYDVKQKPQLQSCRAVCAFGYYCRFPIRCNFKWLSQDGGGRNSLKISAPRLLIKIYQMRPLSVRSGILDERIKKCMLPFKIYLRKYSSVILCLSVDPTSSVIFFGW
jgi:hypothetical protein